MTLCGNVWNVACFILISLLTTSTVGRVQGQQAEGENEIPSFPDLESLMGLDSQGRDLYNFMNSVSQALVPSGTRDSAVAGQNVRFSRSTPHAASLLQRGVGSHGLQSQLHSNNKHERSDHRRAEDPLIDISVETQFVDDLLANDAGRKQMEQMNAELKNTVNALFRGAHVEQQRFQQAERMLGDLNANGADRTSAQAEQVLNFLQQGRLMEQQFKHADRTVKELMANEAGKKQIRQETGQLNIQLQHAVNSLNDGVREMKQAAGDLQTSRGESALGGIVKMLNGESSWDELLQRLLGRESSQAAGQLREAMSQFPALEDVTDIVYRLLKNSEPSATKNVQQLLAAFGLPVSKDGDSVSGPESITRMVDAAITSLKDNMEMLTAAVYKALRVTRDPRLLQAAKDMRCLTKSVIGEAKDSGLGLQCARGLLQSANSLESSEQMVASLTESLAFVLNDPPLVQSFVAMLKATNWNTTFSLMRTVVGNFSTADENLRAAVQIFQATMTGLTQDRHLSEGIRSLMQSFDTSSVFEYSMQLLKNATAGDPASQQLLVIVNDTVISAWKGSGDLEQTVDNLKEIVVTLNNTQDPSQPVSQTQQAFLNLLVRLMEIVVNAYKKPDQGTTQHPVMTAKPTAITTPNAIGTTPVSMSFSTAPSSTTRVQPSTTAETSKFTTKPRTSVPTRVTISTTARKVENDDATEDRGNGEAHISWSGLCMILGLACFRSASACMDVRIISVIKSVPCYGLFSRRKKISRVNTS